VVGFEIDQVRSSLLPRSISISFSRSSFLSLSSSLFLSLSLSFFLFIFLNISFTHSHTRTHSYTRRCVYPAAFSISLTHSFTYMHALIHSQVRVTPEGEFPVPITGISIRILKLLLSYHPTHHNRHSNPKNPKNPNIITTHKKRILLLVEQYSPQSAE
jgi:hypothetical protein